MYKRQFPKIPDILEEVDAAVDTDLSVSQMIRLAGILKDAREKGINTEMVPGTPAYIGDISYWPVSYTHLFLTNVAEHVGDDSKYIHKGMTSSDVKDTALGVMMKRSADVILADLELSLIHI